MSEGMKLPWRRKSQKDVVQTEASNESDIMAFLAPSIEKANSNAQQKKTNQPTPRIDVASAQRFPQATGIADLALNLDRSPQNTFLRPMRPRGPGGRSVSFSDKDPDIIGEGGDDADLPPAQIKHTPPASRSRSAEKGAPGQDESFRPKPFTRTSTGLVPQRPPTPPHEPPPEPLPVFRPKPFTRASTGMVSPPSAAQQNSQTLQLQGVTRSTTTGALSKARTSSSTYSQDENSPPTSYKSIPQTHHPQAGQRIPQPPSVFPGTPASANEPGRFPSSAYIRNDESPLANYKSVPHSRPPQTGRRAPPPPPISVGSPTSVTNPNAYHKDEDVPAGKFEPASQFQPPQVERRAPPPLPVSPRAPGFSAPKPNDLLSSNSPRFTTHSRNSSFGSQPPPSPRRPPRPEGEDFSNILKTFDIDNSPAAAQQRTPSRDSQRLHTPTQSATAHHRTPSKASQTSHHAPYQASLEVSISEQLDQVQTKDTKRLSLSHFVIELVDPSLND
ncbi:hypothetical protein LTS18_010773, partial [Coniosporium uncinatum]